MGKVVLDITMSLDGFIAGPNNFDSKNPLGDGGERLHNWLFKDKTDVDSKVIAETVETSGAVVVGGTTYTYGIDEGWGGVSPFQAPAFVLLHKVPEKSVEGFIYVTEGIEVAIRKAKAGAGQKNIWVMGGANIIQQLIKAKLFDELHIHIAPVLFIRGTRLFDNLGETAIELKSTSVVGTDGAIHMKYALA